MSQTAALSRNDGNTLPEFVICDECGAEARVRSCGRVEYDWPKAHSRWSSRDHAQDKLGPPHGRLPELRRETAGCGIGGLDALGRRQAGSTPPTVSTPLGVPQ